MKKYIAMLLSCILIMSQGTIIFAGENDDTEVQYEMVEISDENMPILRLVSGHKRFAHKQ